MYMTEALKDIEYFKGLNNSIEINYMLKESNIIISKGYDKELLHEEIKKQQDSSKNFFKKIIERIKELWDKFLLNMSGLFQKDAKWLESNKELISKIEIPETYTVNMFDFEKGASIMDKFLISNQFPPINNKDMLQSLEDKNTFRSKYFRNFMTSKDPEFLMIDLKDSFRGGKKETDFTGSQIQSKILDMYRYCIGYKNKVNDLTKDYNALKTRVDDIIREIDDIEVKATNENFYVMVENCDFNKIPKSDIEIFQEAKIKNTAEDNKDKQVDPEKTKEEDLKNKVTVQGSKDVKESTVNKSKLISKYRLYVSEYYAIMSIKMSVMELRYNEYMKILKYFVLKVKK